MLAGLLVPEALISLEMIDKVADALTFLASHAWRDAQANDERRSDG